jgi:hypothetical protein
MLKHQDGLCCMKHVAPFAMLDLPLDYTYAIVKNIFSHVEAKLMATKVLVILSHVCFGPTDSTDSLTLNLSPKALTHYRVLNSRPTVRSDEESSSTFMKSRRKIRL